MKSFPDGSIDPTDEGEFAMSIYIQEGRVVMDFRRKLTWIGFDKPSLESLIATLSAKLNELP